jgi:hypothetical protein
MGLEGAGADADGVTFSRTSDTTAPEIAMQFFSSSQFPWATAKPPVGMAPRLPSQTAAASKVDCGWYDSSFDLAMGLEVSEEDCHTLYQLWELSQH